MARVVGLDIGHTSVKTVTLETALRNVEFVAADEEPIVRALSSETDAEPAQPPEAGSPDTPDTPDSSDSAEPSVAEVEAAIEGSIPTLGDPVLTAIRALADRGVFDADAVYASLAPGDVLLTKLNLPFSSPREIEAVLAPQLEGRIPREVDELSLNFMRGGKLPSGEFSVFAAGVDPALLAVALDELDGLGIDPRALDIPPFSLVTAARAALGDRITAPVAIVDIGATTTGVAIIDADDVQYARTFPGGGDRVTAALAKTFGIDDETAREGKHREGFIDVALPEQSAPTGDDAVDIASACRTANKTIVRQLRRTLHAHATDWGVGVEAVYLCGGAAQLRGLPEYIEQSLGVPTHMLEWAPLGDKTPEFASALGLAMRGSSVPNPSTMNARVGPFAFKGSYEYVRQRIPQLAFGIGVLVVLSLAFSLGRLTLLNAEVDASAEALREASTALFGEPMGRPSDVESELRMGAVRPAFVPKQSAYGLFVDVAAAIGGTVDLGYDVEGTEIEVDLERRIFRVRGAADSAESVDTFEGELAAVECLTAIERTDLSRAQGGDGFRFSVQGEVRCGGAPEGEQ